MPTFTLIIQVDQQGCTLRRRESLHHVPKRQSPFIQHITISLTSHLQQVILSALGVPGALLAGWAVELPYIGRKGTLAISAGE